MRCSNLQALLLSVLFLFLSSLLPAAAPKGDVFLFAHGVSVQKSLESSLIEANFPEEVEAEAVSVEVEASGYPTRALEPLTGALLSGSADLIKRAASAFKADE